MTDPRGIILLEGADSSGKSTLAHHFVDRYGARYLHSTVRKDIWRYHVGALRMAVRYSQDGLVVMDRHWISELVYASVFRGGPAYDVGARCFDRVLRRHGALIVLCSPSDQLRQERRWADGRAAGKHEHFSRVREVIQLYADLRHGNVGHPGDLYLDQLIRFQDFTARDDVMVYDLDENEGARGVIGFSRRAIARLEFLQKASLPRVGHNLVGRTDEDASRSVLFVGEAPSPATKNWPSRWPVWPWFDHDHHASAATWLNRAIHHLALREDRLLFTNAEGDYDYLPMLLSLSEESPSDRVIALGERAHARVRALGGRCRVIPHPGWHRRFKYGEGPEGYAEVYLKEVLR